MNRATFTLVVGLLTACSAGSTAVSTVADDVSTTVRSFDTEDPVPTSSPSAPRDSTSTVATTRTTLATTTTALATTTTTQPVTHVSSPGTFDDRNLVIHVGFRSEISDVTAGEFESTAMAILNDPDGWSRSGFTFVADETSELLVVLANGPRVDELCLPLTTGGTVSCQNGPVVALNADRWRIAARGWDSTIDAYRTYLVNHEVGHLIGLRHPADRCPADEEVSAVMEPQTNSLLSCAGNGVPLSWEVDWAMNRPSVIGPTPDWDGPRPSWP